MIPNPQRSRTLVFTAVFAPVGLFAGYVAYLIVPAVIRTVVPMVIESLTSR